MIMKKFIYLLMLVGVVSLMLGCPGASDPLAAPVSGPPASESSESAQSSESAKSSSLSKSGPTESAPTAKSSSLSKSGPTAKSSSLSKSGPPLSSLTAKIEWTGYRNVVVGITANQGISDVGVILSDDDSLKQTPALKAEKVYYKRKLVANKKILVHLGLLNGFTLANDNPNPSVIKTGVNPATLRIPQPGKTYYVYVFYGEHNERLEVTTIALHTGASAVEGGESLHAQIVRLGKLSYRLGESHIFPMVLRRSGASTHTFVGRTKISGDMENLFDHPGLKGNLKKTTDKPGYIFYEYSTSSDTTFRDAAIFHVIQQKDLTYVLNEIYGGAVLTSGGFSFVTYNLELNQ